MSSGGQQPVTQQTQQTRDPWSAAQPHLQNVMGQAANLIGSDIGYQPYGGQMQAGEHPWLNQTFSNISAPLATESWGGTGYFGSPGVNAARTKGLELINNYGLSPEMQNLYNRVSTTENPYLQGVINQQVNKANAGASAAGRYGSGMHDAAIAQAIAPTLAQEYTQRQQQAQDILTGGLTRQGQWSENMPALDQARWQSAQMLAGMGQYEMDRNQQAINNAIQLWNQSQARPWEQLARYNAMATQAGGLGGTQTTGIPVNQPSTLQRIFGGGLAGAGLGASIGGLPGAGIGALGGGLLGLL